MVRFVGGARNTRENDSPAIGDTHTEKTKAAVASTMRSARKQYKKRSVEASCIEYGSPMTLMFQIAGARPAIAAEVNDTGFPNPKRNHIRKVRPAHNAPQSADTNPEGHIVREIPDGKT